MNKDVSHIFYIKRIYRRTKSKKINNSSLNIIQIQPETRFRFGSTFLLGLSTRRITEINGYCPGKNGPILCKRENYILLKASFSYPSCEVHLS